MFYGYVRLCTVRHCNQVADKQQNVYINACCGVCLDRIFLRGGEGRGAQKALFPFKLFQKLAGGRLAKLLELLSLKNLMANIGQEHKNIFLHFKLIISSNFGLFCGVDFPMDSFYWILQFSVKGSNPQIPPMATATRLNVKNKYSSITDDHLEQRMRLATTSLEADIREFGENKSQVAD